MLVASTFADNGQHRTLMYVQGMFPGLSKLQEAEEARQRQFHCQWSGTPTLVLVNDHDVHPVRSGTETFKQHVLDSSLSMAFP